MFRDIDVKKGKWIYYRLYDPDEKSYVLKRAYKTKKKTKYIGTKFDPGTGYYTIYYGSDKLLYVREEDKI